jgi:hypothetical protein
MSSSPPGVEASFGLDGLTATLPGARLSRHDILTIGALLIGGTELLVLLLFVADLLTGGWFLEGDFSVLAATVVALPIVFLPFIAHALFKFSASPITVTLSHTYGATYRWVGDDFDQSCKIYDLKEATVPRGGDPRVLLRLWDGSGQEWRLRRWEDADWLALQLNEAVALAAARQGKAVVPEAIRRLRSAPPKLTR